MTMRLHSPQVHGFFSVPTDPLTARPVFIEHLRQRELNPQTTVVVAPDMGTAKQTARFAKRLGLPSASANKTRISDTAVQIAADLLQLSVTVVEGYEHAIVYDDEIATGGSAIEVSQLLIECGIHQITLACTHGLFLGSALERLAAIPEIVEIISTDTVALPPEKVLPKMTILSVSSVFGKAILQNYLRQSIGDLFTFWDED